MDSSFVLPDSYESVLKYAPEEVRPMVSAALEMNVKQRQAAQQEIEQQKQYLREQYQLGNKLLDDAVSKLPTEQASYPAVQYGIQNQRAKLEYAIKRKLIELNAYGMSPEAAASQIKADTEVLTKDLDPKLKPFEETPQAKYTFENWDILKKKQSTIDVAKGQLQIAQDIYSQALEAKANGDLAGFDRKSKEAADFMKTNLIKTLNSIVSNDAIQLSEMITRYPDLLTGTQYAQLSNLSTFNPRVWVNRLFEKGNEIEKGDALKTIFNKIQDASPGRFIVNAANGVNSVLAAHNQEIETQVYRTSSPNFGKKIGAVKYELFDPTKMGDNTYSAQGGSPAVQGGSTYAPRPGSTPVAAPAAAQSQQSPSYSSDIIEKAKKALSSPDATEQHKAAAKQILGIQ